MKIIISATDARIILKAIDAPSAINPKLAVVFYKIARQLKPTTKGTK